MFAIDALNYSTLISNVNIKSNISIQCNPRSALHGNAISFFFGKIGAAAHRAAAPCGLFRNHFDVSAGQENHLGGCSFEHVRANG